MALITLIRGDASDHGRACDLLLTDPPYDMSGTKLASIFDRYECDHLVLITTMGQLLDFLPRTTWRLQFDFVIDAVVPKKSRNYRQPHYLHQTGVYLTRNGAKSRFDRRRRQRSDVFEGNGYWPTVFHAPRDTSADSGYAKNPEAICDLLGSFDAASVCDPFAGGGSTAMAAYELHVPCTLVEKCPDTFNQLEKTIKFACPAYGVEVIHD